MWSLQTLFTQACTQSDLTFSSIHYTVTITSCWRTCVKVSFDDSGCKAEIAGFVVCTKGFYFLGLDPHFLWYLKDLLWSLNFLERLTKPKCGILIFFCCCLALKRVVLIPSFLILECCVLLLLLTLNHPGDRA